MSAQRKLPPHKYYIVTVDGNITTSLRVYPFGDFELEWTNKDHRMYSLELTGNLIFKDYSDDQKQFIDDYTKIKQYENDGFVIFRIDKLCGDSYTTEWTGKISTRGEWNRSTNTLTTTAFNDDNQALVNKNKSVQYNLFGLGLTSVITKDVIDNIDYPQTFLFTDVIQAVLSRFSDMTLVSQFFTSATNPVDASDSPYSFTRIAQIVDVKYPTASTLATHGDITLDLIIKWLYLFGCDYYISGDNFIIEHESFFNNGYTYTGSPVVGLDLTSSEYADFLVNKNIYSYNKAVEYLKESWIFEYGLMIHFKNFDIDYSESSQSEEIDKKEFTKLYTDIKGIREGTQFVKDEGFCLLFSENISGTYYLKHKTITFPYNLQDLIKGWTNDSWSAISAEANWRCVAGDVYELIINITTKPSGADASFAASEKEYSGSLVTTETLFSTLSLGENSINYTVLYNQEDSTTEFAFAGFCFCPNGYDGSRTGDRGDWEFISFRKAESYNVKNGALSPNYLFNKYGLYNKLYEYALVHGENAKFVSTQKTKIGVELTNIPICCTSFNPHELIKTDLGTGELISGKIHEDRTMNLNIKY